ncbi:IS110 family transposase [Desulfosarcina ovata]|uniref:Transposase IS110-like N-terminal domain-containing protein n=1 Tax=Desulfosarcina ovata subsp. ovata TaxID=2752305 RepID=A0A5K8AFP7_9BACT|nr:transposase [Desulfosarcina ovata]BBO90734.1 hypothetical protein DSCOOX_39140 [Desulfosarcina ovata subsp. ovata]
MSKIVKYVGLGFQKDSITIAIADEGRDGNVRLHGKIHNDLGQHDNVMSKLISENTELRCAYEAGPCGYTIYRHLKRQGIDCVVGALALIPKKAGDQVKNDRRDATNLAKLHHSGDLTPVYVPDETNEALQDLVQTRKDISMTLRKAKQQIIAFVLRQGLS